MRLLSLEFEKYGPFTGKTIEFRLGARLHLVHGHNEAGKSSALTAICDLLYGVPGDTPQNFLHRNPDLRVGGAIEARDGRRLHFFRRKGNKGTIIDPKGFALPDDALVSFLGGVDRDIFRRAFGLDAGRLRSGAEELVASHDEVGESLLAAAAGLRGLSDLRRALEGEADKIFAPRASQTRRFYQAHERYETARKAVNETQLRAGEWKKLNDDIERLAARLEELKQKRGEAAAAREKISRLKRLRPTMQELDARLAERAALGDLPELPPGFGARLANAMADAAAAEADAATARAALADIDAAIADLAGEPALIARAGEIESLHRRIEGYLNARRDLPRVRAEADAYELDLTAHARALGLAGAADFEPAMPTAATQALARRLAIEGEDLARSNAELAGELAEEERKLESLEAKSRQRGALVDPDPAREKYAAFGNLGALVEKRAETERALLAEAEQLRRAAARLTPPAGDPEELAQKPLPDAETIARFTREYEGHEERLRRAREAEDASASQISALEQRLRDLSAARPVVTPALLSAARGRRDEAWEKLRGRLLDAARGPADAALLGDLAAFQGYVVEADRLADEIARDASRVAEHALKTSQLESERAALAAGRARRAEIEAAFAETRGAWMTTWAGCAVAPLAPREMAAWLTSARALIERRERSAERGALLAQLDRDIDNLRAPLAAFARDIGAAAADGPDPLAAARAIEARLRELARIWDEARGEEQTRRDLAARVADMRRDLDEIARKTADWRARWRDAAASLGLSPTATTTEAFAALDVWKLVPGNLRERATREARVADMRAYIGAFDADARALVAEFAPDAAPAAAVEAIESFQKRLAVARGVDARRADALRRKAQCEAGLAKAEAALAARRAARDALATRLPGNAALEDMRDRLIERDRLAGAASDLREQARRMGEDLDSGDLRAELAAFDAARADLELADLADAEARLAQEDREAFAELKSAREKREAWSAGSGAEIAMQERRNAEAELREAAREWAVLKIGALIIEEALARRREGQQDPLLRRAGELLALLTGGAFTGIERVIEDDDSQRLTALRAGGQRLRVEPGVLSEGTLDQLYLALRLAYIEDYAARAEPAPFIGDDLFASFDDRRTGFGLTALRALGEHAQTILFTHHRHVVDIAREKLGPDVDVIELHGG